MVKELGGSRVDSRRQGYAERCGLAIVTLGLCWLVPAQQFESGTRADPQDQDAATQRSFVEIGGQRFGARADAEGPIGGGAGYARVLRSGQHVVRSFEALQAALRKAKAGQVVFVPGDVEIDCTGPVHIDQAVIEIPGGVTLASDRGVEDAPGAVLYSDSLATRPLIRVLGPGARVTGLRLRGPDPERRLAHWERAFRKGKGRAYFYGLPVAAGIHCEQDGLEVDNCELSGWSHCGILLSKSVDHRVHHNYVHHNQRQGLGYGMTLDVAEARIHHNLFDWNRHSIASTGRPGSGYEAHDNIERGTSLSHCFDMHGGRDRKDGTDIAGTWMKVHHNSFFGPMAAIAIRGVPQKEARIEFNWFWHAPGDTRNVRGGGTRTIVGPNAHGREHPHVADPQKGR